MICPITNNWCRTNGCGEKCYKRDSLGYSTAPQHDAKLPVSSRVFIPESAQEWLLTGDRGISSETIFGAITGLVINRRKYPPADPADFYRCYKLIKAVPEWKSELHKVAELSKPWKNVIDNWDKLSELLEEQIEWRDKGISASNGMYEFMKQLGC